MMFTIGDVLNHKHGQPKKPKKIFLRDMRQHDLAHGECLVRELEMTVDGELREAAYSVQFWRDMELYGIDEAMDYLETANVLKDDKRGFDNVLSVVVRIKHRIRSKQS
jgi:hypothetical protein